MSLQIPDDMQVREAVRHFWVSRRQALSRQIESGRSDQGERGGVTAGKNMAGFVRLIQNLVQSNGLSDADVFTAGRMLNLPGYFRAAKCWDVLIVREGRLIGAIEMKSHVGPSFSNNFNNRAEEAIGMGHDFRVALREGALGEQLPPFIGWVMLVEDAAASRSPVGEPAGTFPVFPEFRGASYVRRYELLCRRLVREQLYSSAALLASPRAAEADGCFHTESEDTSFGSFLAALAAHVAMEATRRPAAGTAR